MLFKNSIFSSEYTNTSNMSDVDICRSSLAAVGSKHMFFLGYNNFDGTLPNELNISNWDANSCCIDTLSLMNNHLTGELPNCNCYFHCNESN